MAFVRSVLVVGGDEQRDERQVVVGDFRASGRATEQAGAEVDADRVSDVGE
jgi:hypothetical protein